MPKNKKKQKSKKQSSTKSEKSKYTAAIKLKVAKKIDFLEVEKVVKGRKVWRAITGVPYWMLDSNGEIENKNYIFDDSTDFKTFSDYLNRKQILIPR